MSLLEAMRKSKVDFDSGQVSGVAPGTVSKTDQLYCIPRMCEDGKTARDCAWSAECFTWPRYYNGEFKLSNPCGPSMLELDATECLALRVVILRCELKESRYGAAHQKNFKKVGLSRAYFPNEMVTEERMPSPRAAAAFRYLMAHNEYYKAFHQQHAVLLAQKKSLNISSYGLFVVYDGIECAMFPHLYPCSASSDTGILQHYRDRTGDKTPRIVSIGLSWVRKILSEVRVYGEQRDLPFFLYERHMARKFFAAHVRGQSMGVTGDVMTRDSQASGGYWESTQDALADLVRIMLQRCYDKENYPELYNGVRGVSGAQVWMTAFPNLFITVAPAEWKFQRPYFLMPYRHCVFRGAAIMALHMYCLVRCVWLFLASPFGHRWFMVYEWVMKTEYQGRDTPHWHIAAWVLSMGLMKLLAGRTGTAVVSCFVKFLELVFHCEIDVQIGNGRLNYINGYVAKDHDSVDVGLGEYVQKESTSPWLAAYRLISKSTPGLPEVTIRMAQYPEFQKSYSSVLLYPPQPRAMVSLEGRQRGNFSSKMYGIYLEEQRQRVAAGMEVNESFLVWHRSREYDKQLGCMVFRGGQHQQAQHKTLTVACRYWYELTDGYWGQLTLTQIPHLLSEDILPQENRYLDAMENFAGMVEYLRTWRWQGERSVRCRSDLVFSLEALPLVVSEEGHIIQLSSYVAGGPVFPSDRAAFDYMLAVAKRDLQYRGFRDDRLSSFAYKQEANYLLYVRVRDCGDEVEYAYLRQCWDTLNRPKHRDLVWSVKQQEALDKVDKGISYGDEDEKRQSSRHLYLSGAPGSGKSALILEAAIRAAKKGIKVLIVCPTGQLVHSFKAALPEFDGVENISIDTIHGVLGYKRPGKDQLVQWAPPSALRRIDLILADEGSQYDDREWTRFFQSIQEQPHSPFMVVVADFQQLQPVVSGGLCRQFCEKMDTVTLDTVYRSTDEDHLLFLNRIRFKQPYKPQLRQYWEGERHWRRLTLHDAVRRGMRIQRETEKPFSWLCCTNKGASAVCEAALDCLGVSQEERAQGYLCDPATKSTLRIVAKPGILIRLSRNFDKQRGFVNGSLAVIVEALKGNAVFVARLIGTGNYVLVHPMEENGARFLPCSYGYATTIRRAQGASLDQGCIYFDQKKFHAGRGYGYVAVSRFKTKDGCFLFGRMRATDFLPVGEDGHTLERGYDSLSSSESDNEGRGLADAFGSGSEDGSSGMGSDCMADVEEDHPEGPARCIAADFEEAVAEDWMPESLDEMLEVEGEECGIAVDFE